MRKIKFVKTLVIFVCIGIYGYSAVDTNTGQMYNISIDAGKPLSIVWPVEVAVVGDNGEKGLRIGPKIGRGWRGEAGGEASYKFYIPQDDRYYIWAYCLWFDECANAIFAKFDDSDKAIIGNDPIYKQWHWVRGFDIHLKKGTHTLVLSNHSDHISLQKLLLINSASTTPEDCILVFSDIFYDGFDGCDQGNFDRWRQICGSWHVKNPESQTCLIENALIGESVDKAFIIYESDNWDSYCLDLSVKLLPSDSEDCSVGICFGVNDANSFYQLKIKPIQADNKASMAVLGKQFHKSITLSEFELPFRVDQWHHVQIYLYQRWIEIKIEEYEPVKVSVEEQTKGGIGLILEGQTTAYFDNIHVRQVTRTEHER
jgi:hypothetical protein